MPTPILQDISLAQSQQQPLSKPTPHPPHDSTPYFMLDIDRPEEYDDSALYN